VLISYRLKIKIQNRGIYASNKGIVIKNRVTGEATRSARRITELRKGVRKNDVA
jgi:hypothetical protein